MLVRKRVEGWVAHDGDLDEPKHYCRAQHYGPPTEKTQRCRNTEQEIADELVEQRPERTVPTKGEWDTRWATGNALLCDPQQPIVEQILERAVWHADVACEAARWVRRLAPTDNPENRDRDEKANPEAGKNAHETLPQIAAEPITGGTRGNEESADAKEAEDRNGGHRRLVQNEIRSESAEVYRMPGDYRHCKRETEKVEAVVPRIERLGQGRAPRSRRVQLSPHTEHLRFGTVFHERPQFRPTQPASSMSISRR